MDESIANPQRGDGTMWAYGRVREAILACELAPGSRVSQVRLATDLGISRPTLREALRLLQNEGLIRAEPNRQVRVAPLEIEDFEQLNALRLAVEPMAVHLSVAKLTDQDLAELAEAKAEHDRLRDGEDPAGVAVAHHCFHALTYSRAGERVRRAADDLWRSAERYRRLMVNQNSDAAAVSALARDDHTQILRAALDRDAPRCADLVARHIAKMSTIAFSLIDSSRDPAAFRAATERTFTAKAAS